MTRLSFHWLTALALGLLASSPSEAADCQRLISNHAPYQLIGELTTATKKGSSKQIWYQQIRHDPEGTVTSYEGTMPDLAVVKSISKNSLIVSESVWDAPSKSWKTQLALEYSPADIVSGPALADKQFQVKTSAHEVVRVSRKLIGQQTVRLANCELKILIVKSHSEISDPSSIAKTSDVTVGYSEDLDEQLFARSEYRISGRLVRIVEKRATGLEDHFQPMTNSVH